MAPPVESTRLLPPPLTPAQKRVFAILTVLIGLTRFPAIARSLFDWDEALFARGVREFDVVLHQPHPPGYPLFVAAAKCFHLLGANEFHALQIVVVAGGVLLFPALFWLARECGFDFTTAATAGALYAFFPNVWLYGGTGFSDVPSTAVALLACALLLRGRTDRRAYVAGAVVLGIAAGMRTPNLLLGFVPALLSTAARLRARDFGAVGVAVLAGAAIVAGSYGGAAVASESVADYVEAVRGQSRYVREVDSWRNPRRGPLSDAAVTFLLRPFHTEDALNVLAIAAAFSLVAAVAKRRVAPLLAVAVFAPLAITAWLNLDINTAGRYAIGYMGAHALLAMDGFRVIGRVRAFQVALCVAAVGYFGQFTWPALQTQRTTNSPPAAALLWVRRNVLQSTPVYVHGSFGPHAKYYLWDYDVRLFDEAREIPPTVDAWVVHWQPRSDALNFVRPHGRMWLIVRRRAFEASVSHASSLIRFGRGWHQEEAAGTTSFRWMTRDSETTLPAIDGNARLELRMFVPADAKPSPADIEVRLNGVLLERIRSSGETLERSWVVPSRRSAINELRITTSASVRPADGREGADPRELGLRVDVLKWIPAR